jgi:succinyl-CoA synthetase beta subunit
MMAQADARQDAGHRADRTRGQAGQPRLYRGRLGDRPKEFYLALLVDRAQPTCGDVVSTEGGMDIEEVAAEDAEKILSFPIDPATGYQPFHGRKVAFALGLTASRSSNAAR